MSWNKAWLGLLLGLSLGFSNILWALPEDAQAPVEIEADSADLDQKRQITVYSGHVSIRQGSMSLRADRVEIHYQNNRPHLLIATGNPASIRQKPAPDKPWVTGKGLRITYYLNKEEAILEGQAELIQAQDRFQSDRIVYNRKTARLKAGTAAQGKNRVKVIIQSESLQ